MEQAWALFRIEFPYASEYVLSVTPWGGDRAVIVTTDGVYLAKADSETGFVLTKVTDR